MVLESVAESFNACIGNWLNSKTMTETAQPMSIKIGFLTYKARYHYFIIFIFSKVAEI